ncbi:uncharacterized protein AKAME5_002720500 [Lates japonicus]|uniref:Uncharacterized protein n=1 Tax=Lates japonicus TaxID=270547 RepID=A0AAD3QXW5_LATJO|nr:uncharacterized protein AKAME5_002720500 [Lates japonicus]
MVCTDRGAFRDSSNTRDCSQTECGAFRDSTNTISSGVSVLLLSGLTVSVVFCPYCICSVLLVSICCSRKTGNKPAVSMETTPPVGGGGEDDDVTTEHDF